MKGLKNQNKDINYKKIFKQLIDIGLINCIKQSEIFINHYEFQLKLLYQRKNSLLENEPFLFKKSWNKELEEVDNEIFEIYQKVGVELKEIEEIQQTINQN